MKRAAIAVIGLVLVGCREKTDFREIVECSDGTRYEQVIPHGADHFSRLIDGRVVIPAGEKKATAKPASVECTVTAIPEGK